jgi:hypothetical protein
VWTLNVYMLILIMSSRQAIQSYFNTSFIIDIAAQAMVQLSTVWTIVYDVDSTTITIWAIAFSVQTVKFY